MTAVLIIKIGQIIWLQGLLAYDTAQSCREDHSATILYQWVVILNPIAGDNGMFLKILAVLWLCQYILNCVTALFIIPEIELQIQQSLSVCN